MAQTKTRPFASPKAAAVADWPARITGWAFVLAIVVVCVRATMIDTLRDPFDPQPGMPGAPRDGAGPSASLLLNLICCLPALMVLGRRVFDRTYVIRWSWSHVPMLALAIWMAMSVTWAGDKFAALIGAANFVGAAAIFWAATQLVRSWGRLRLVAAAAFGVLLIYAAAGIEYRLVDLPELRKNFETNRKQILQEQGLEEGSFEAQQFERKTLGGDVGRFCISPNTYAAALVLLGVVAAGVLAQRISNREHPGWIIAIAPVFPMALYAFYYTHSRTAMATIVAAAGLLVMVRSLPNWLNEHAKLAYWLGVGLFAAGTLAIVGHGLTHGSLIDKSLTFRWYYWSGAARLVSDAPLTGVGWNNFGQRYLQVRGPLATEQVQDPHNFIVKAFAELGIIGGVLMVAWMMRLWWELTRTGLPSPSATPTIPPKRRPLAFLAWLSTGTMLLGFLISTDFGQGYAWIFLQGFRYAMGALLLLAGLVAVSFSSLREERFDESASPWILYGILVAVGVFLLHNLVDFALSETSTLYLFALLAGSAAGARHPSLAGRQCPQGMVIGIFASATLVWLIAAGTVWGKTLAAELAASDGAAAIREKRLDLAFDRYRAAAIFQPLNADYSYRAAQALMYMSVPRSMVIGVLEQAIQTNPYSVKYYRTQAAFELEQPSPDKTGIMQAYRNALNLDPRNVGLRLAYADTLANLGEKAAAVEQYRQALRHDDQLPPDEPKRLSQTKRQQIERTIAEMGGQ